MKDIFLKTLKEHGISEDEYLILSAIDLHGQLTPEKLPEYAVFLSSCAESASCIGLYQVATDSCFAKGWLKVLNAEDCEKDHLRWRSDFNQSCGETEYRIGDVNFTQKGGHFYYPLYAEWYTSQNWLSYQGSIDYAWNMPGQVRVFTPYEENI